MSSRVYPVNCDKNGCCCEGKQPDDRGKTVGWITGHRALPVRITFLRRDPSAKRQMSCPFHASRRDCNINNINCTQNNLDNEKPKTMADTTLANDTRVTYKDIICIWHKAVEDSKNGGWEAAYNGLQQIKDYSAMMRFNLGQIALVLDKVEPAKENFLVATEKDPHMALAHFQLGMVYYRLHRYNDSRSSYEKAKNCLRGNKFIDYRQLGFVHKLYECDVLYNLALTYATMMNSSEWATEMLRQASKVTVEPRQATLIEKAQNQLMNNQLFDPIVLPSNQLFRPPKSKVQNLKEVNYLGKAKVVSELPESSNNNNKANFKPPPGKEVPPPPNTFRPIDDFSDDDVSPPPYADGTSSPTPSTVARMTHKDTIAIWNEGVVAFEKGDINEALNQLNSIIDPSAKILHDIGLLQMKLSQFNDAVATFKEVVSKDPHLAIGHFQLGVALGKLDKFDEAWRSFEKTQETLRGNKMIDYKQLGLALKLHKCEVLHNQAWTYNELDQPDWAKKLLYEARDCKADPRHDKVDDSVQSCLNGRSFKLLEPPKVLLFKPPKSKIDNLQKKDYLGKAKIVAKLPSQRQGSSTPPPTSSNSLGVAILPPRSRTPTPREIAQSGPGPARPPAVERRASSPPPPSRAIPGLPPRISLPDTQAPWKLAPPSQESPRSTSPALPRRPPPVLKSDSGQDTKRSSRFSPDQSLPPEPVGRVSPDDADKPPSRPLPSPNRSSPVPSRPVPPPPQKGSSSEAPSRALPPSPKISKSDLANRPVPMPPMSGDVDLSSRPVPPRPVSNISDRTASPLPRDDAPDLPSRPVPPVPRSGSPSLPRRPSPPMPKTNLPSKPVPSSPELPSRPVPAAPRTGSPDLPSRPIPPSPKLSSGPPSKALPGPPRKTSSGSPLPDRPVPLPPQSNKNFRTERRSSSPGLPDLPPPPPPQKSPTPPRSLGVSLSNSNDRKSPVHGFQAKVGVIADSPPVVRKAAVITAQSKDKPVLPARPGLPSKPGLPGKPVLEVKPVLNAKRSPGHQPLKPGKRKTALVIETYDTDKFGEINVREGDMVSVLDEEHDWLQVEFKGQKGRLPKSCVKDFNKPATELPF